jgi:CotH protein/lamin tail-like protein
MWWHLILTFCDEPTGRNDVSSADKPMNTSQSAESQSGQTHVLEHGPEAFTHVPLGSETAQPQRGPRVTRLMDRPQRSPRGQTLAWLRAFAWAALAMALGLASRAFGDPIISEFMASNTTTITDENGNYPDWIEIYNPDNAPINLNGWYLTDSAKKKTKWAFPSITVAPQGYLVVFASGDDQRDPSKPLHTTFKLSADSGYIGLIKPDGVTVATEFAPSYPPQHPDISYGVTQPTDGSAPQVGYFRTATPGAANGGNDGLMLPDTVTFSQNPGPFTGTLSLELTGAGAGEHIRYVAALPSSAGAAVPAPTKDSPEYTGPLTINSSVIVRAAVFLTDDSMSGLTGTAQYVAIAATGGARVDTFSSQLPVLVIDDHGYGPLIKDDIDHPAWIYSYPAAGDGVPVFANAPAAATPITASVHGESSADFDKKSYNISIKDDFGKKSTLALAGDNSFQKWVLIGPWKYDQSLIHNTYVYALSNRIGRWAPQSHPVEVFFNSSGSLDASAYAGVYELTDKIEIDPNRVALASLASTDVTAPAITGGYIIKVDVPDPTEYSFVTDHGFPDNGTSAVIVASPGLPDLVPAQQTYIRGYIQQLENSLYADQAAGWTTRTHLDYIDRASWVDYHILNTLVMNVDALQRSAYFTKNRGGKMVAGPVWDYDRSLNSTDPRTARWDVWMGDGGTNLWTFGWWGVLATDPEFMQAWVDRWQSLRTTQFSDQSLSALADSIGSEVGEAAAARDAARFPDDLNPYGSYAGEIGNLKDWLTHHAAWIDQQFLAAPTVASSGGNLIFTAPPNAKLVYTLDGSDPRSLGGNPAPGTQIATSPLTVPASANVHVRSYNPEIAAAPAASPWSSAVGSDNSSPLAPASSLVNISSRAIVGAGEDLLIAGVTVADTASKGYMARAVGPTLAGFGATATLPDPKLSIFNASGVEIYRNTGWTTGPDAAQLPAVAQAVGAFPLVAGSADAALLAPLAAGGYSFQVSSNSGQSGLALVELYSTDTNGRTINLSTRAHVHTGAGMLIGGFVVQGSAYKRMLIRAVGPTLTTFGVNNVLADPVLTVYSGQTVVASNDNWAALPSDAATITAATTTLGAFAMPTDSKDAALLITLAPGAYTVEVAGKNGGEGVALLEIYEVP